MKYSISIRTLVSAGIFVSTLLISGLLFILVWSETRNNLLVEFDAILINYTYDIKNILNEKSAIRELDIDTEQSIEDKIFPFPHGTSLIQIIDESGLVVAKSASLKEEELPVPLQHLMGAHGSQFDFIKIGDELKDYRMVQIPLADMQGKIQGYIQVAVPTDFIDIQQRKLLRRALIFLPLFLATALLVSWWISLSITAAISKLSSQVQAAKQDPIRSEIAIPIWPIEIRELASSFLELFGDMKRASNLQEEFFHVAAHQLKTPLFILKNEISNSQSIEESFKKTILARIERLAIVTQKLLDFGRSTHRFSSDETVTGHLLDIITDTLIRLNPISEKKNVKLELIAAPESSLTFIGETTLVEQALQNIIDNAIYWAPAGSTVTVALSEEEGFIVARIIDRGPGVSDLALAQLFQPFSGGMNKESSGLGLALAKRVALLHRGELKYTRVGDETVFTFKLKSKP